MPALDFDALLRSVSRGEIAPAYYLHGDQDVLKDEAVQLLLDHGLDPATRDFNLDRRRAADLTPDEFQSLALTPPMLAPRRAVIITEIEDLQQRRTRAQQVRTALLAYLAKPLPETLLILVQSGGEKPDPDFARLTRSVDVKALEPERVRRWIRHRAARDGLELDDGAVAHLFKVVGDDLALVGAELGKLKSAVGSKTATASDVEELVGVRRGETVHEFVDAVTGRRFPAAAAMVTNLLNAPGQSGVQLVMALGTALAGMAVARAHLDGRGGTAAQVLKDAIYSARPIGLFDYGERAHRWAADAADWTAADLDAAFGALLRADRRLKNPTLAGEGDIVVEAVLGMAAAGVPA